MKKRKIALMLARYWLIMSLMMLLISIVPTLPLNFKLLLCGAMAIVGIPCSIYLYRLMRYIDPIV